MLNGDCIGGYTNAQWTSEWGYKEDKGAMLFNLTTHASFPCKGPSSAIFCDKDYGPLFGREELKALVEPFNKENACISYTNDSAYNIPLNSEGINMLTNMKNNRFGTLCRFTITELEVWGVSYND